MNLGGPSLGVNASIVGLHQELEAPHAFRTRYIRDFLDGPRSKSTSAEVRMHGEASQRCNVGAAMGLNTKRVSPA
jgi:hypothetical protein